MTLLPVDVTTSTWRHVALYAQDRRAELAAECCAVATEPGRRSELAARIAELDELIAAPGATKLATEMRAPEQHIRSY